MPVKSNIKLWANLPGVVAAYQPVRAPGPFIARYNQSHGGDNRYRAEPGALPTWSGAAGWTGDGSRWLDTRITWGGSSWSAFVRYSGAISQWLMGADNGSAITRVGFLPNNAGAETRWANTAEKTGPYVGADGVIGFAGTAAYFNGSLVSGAIPTGTAPTPTIAIMAIRRTGGPVAIYTGNILVVAIYARTLSAAEVWSVSRQMAYCNVNPDWSVWSRRRQWYYGSQVAEGINIYRRHTSSTTRVGSRGNVE